MKVRQQKSMKEPLEDVELRSTFLENLVQLEASVFRLLEIQEIGDWIQKAWKDFGKHEKARKNSAYKKKRLNELEAN